MFELLERFMQVKWQFGVCHLIFVFFFLAGQMASNQEDTHETHDTNEAQNEAQNVESEIK